MEIIINIINSVSDLKFTVFFSFISPVNVTECTCVAKINPDYFFINLPFLQTYCYMYILATLFKNIMWEEK